MLSMERNYSSSHIWGSYQQQRCGLGILPGPVGFRGSIQAKELAPSINKQLPSFRVELNRP
jgi:hypothetical protein